MNGFYLFDLISLVLMAFPSLAFTVFIHKKTGWNCFVCLILGILLAFVCFVVCFIFQSFWDAYRSRRRLLKAAKLWTPTIPKLWDERWFIKSPNGTVYVYDPRYKLEWNEYGKVKNNRTIPEITPLIDCCIKDYTIRNYEHFEETSKSWENDTMNQYQELWFYKRDGKVYEVMCSAWQKHPVFKNDEADWSYFRKGII